MLADQLYVRPLGRSNFAQSSEQRARTDLIQFIAKRFLHCDKLPARRAISTAIAPISGVAPQWRYFWGSAGCQPGVSGSLPETIVFRCPTNVSGGAAAGCRGQQAGSLRSPDKKILRSVREVRARSYNQSQRPQESNEAASVQTPDLVSPRTTTMMSRPGREPLAIRQ